MSGCLKCEDLRTEYRIREPWQLKKAIRVVLSNVEDNSIQVDDYWPVGQVGSASTIDDLRSDGFCGDGIEMYFRCTACGQLFVLACETYHGSGGKWQPIQRVLVNFRSPRAVLITIRDVLAVALFAIHTKRPRDRFHVSSNRAASDSG